MRPCSAVLLAPLALALTGCPAKSRQTTTAVPPPTAPSSTPPPTPGASAATPPDPGAGTVADPLATPPPGLPSEVVEEKPRVAGSGEYRPLPDGLAVRSYDGTGLLLDVVVTEVEPGPNRNDPVRLSYAVVAQRSEREHTIARGTGKLTPVTLKLKDKLVQLEVTPRFKPQRLSTSDPSGEMPLLHIGWYDILVRDGQGRPLGRFGVTDMGWVSKAKGADQPSGAVATATEEGNPAGQFFDFFPLSGGAALLRMEAEEYGAQSLAVTAKDGSLHEVTMPHAALRFHAPGDFVTSAERRREDGYGRDPNRDAEPPK